MSDINSEYDGLATTRSAPEEHYCPSCDRSYAGGLELCPEDGTRLVTFATGDEMIGRVIADRFTIQRRLGAGGMGTVYVALQHSIGREVAIKVIHPRLAKDTLIAKRFLREAKLTSRLSHNATITVLDSGQTEDGQLYMVMELLEGHTLGALLKSQPVLDTGRAVWIAAQISSAMIAAHSQDIIHRDLKPANIFLVQDEDNRDAVKVLDFGLAKSFEDSDTALTHSSMLLGTPLYLPPECAVGEAMDARGDLYALGVMLFEMLAGRPPFLAKNVTLLLRAHVEQPPPPLPPQVPEALARIVMRLLAKAPAQRYQSAIEVRQALQSFLNSTNSYEAYRELSTAETAPRGTAAGQFRTPTATVGNAHSPTRSKSRLGLFLLLVVLAAIGASAYFATLSPQEEASVPPVSDASAATSKASIALDASVAKVIASTPSDAGHGQAHAESVDAAVQASADQDAAPALSAEILVLFESQPKGASLFYKGKRECTTPCRLKVASDAEELHVIMRKKGFRQARVPFRAKVGEQKRIFLSRKKSSSEDEDADFISDPRR